MNANVTIALWQALSVIGLAVASGLLFGAALMWKPEGPLPGRPDIVPARPVPPLPRAGSFPTVPLSLLSEHRAQMAAHEREIREMTRAADLLYPPPGKWSQ